MTSQIRPNRQEVSDRFPMLGFTIRTDGESKRYEVAIAVDASLFQSDAKARRTTANFYSSRAAGLQPIDRGEAVYVLPPDVLSRFVGNEKLFYALATYHNGDTTPELSSIPSASSPYINLRSLSGRSLKRIGMLPSRQRAASSYGGGHELEWAGDTVMPGTQAVAPTPAPERANGKSNGGAPAPAAAAAPTAAAAAFEYRDGFGPLPSSPARQAVSRAQSGESYTINWDDVELIPQPTEYTCWATAGAMVIGWSQQVSLTPETIAQICGRSTTSGLSQDDRRKFAREIGLVAEDPQSYTPEGFRTLLENYGPLWVSVQLPGSGHAIVVTGLYSDGAADGSGTYVRISDPWDRVVGKPGAPGSYLETHNSGSRYIMSWADFTTEYEGRASSASDGTVNAQILHAASASGRQPNRSGAAGYAMAAAYTPRARAMTGTSPDTNWADVQLVPEMPGSSCWAAAMAMVVGWRDRISIDPGTIDGKAAAPSDRASLAAAWNLTVVPPASYTALELAIMLRDHGPLWVAARSVSDPHAFVIVQICGDGTPDGTVVYIKDPWGQVTGSPRAPQANPTPGQGSTYSIRYRELAAQYDPSGQTGAPNPTHADLQLIHSSSIDGHESSTLDCAYPSVAAPEGLGMNATARAQSGESFSLNWDEVQSIAQPTDVSCWATAAAMVLGWRDRMSLTPETVASIAGRTTATGLDPAQVGQFASEIGLTCENPQSYTIDGFRQMLESYGPLWVGAAVPGLHAIVVTGMYSDGAEDGSDTYLRITDPWDRVTGSPGSPGAYLNSHNTGSRYILSWAQFIAEYESAATNFSTVNLQILHCANNGGRQPGRKGAVGYAMSTTSAQTVPRRAPQPQVRAQSNECYSLNWDEVEMIPQPTDLSCWATAGAMVIGWRDRICLTPETVAQVCGRDIKKVLYANDFRTFAREIGLTAAPPQCYTPDGLRNLLENNGPVWVGVQLPGSGHAIVVTGMYSDGAPDGSDTYVRITDPWDRVVGTPGTPGSYLNTHNTGSRYIMSWADFTREYEGFANSAADGTVNAQILHSPSAAGRQPNRSGAAGYAMNLGLNGGQQARPAPPPPRPKSQAMNVPAAISAIGGVALERVTNHDGKITWTLDQFRGLKHPNDVVPSSPAAFQDGQTIRLDQWPYVDALTSDRISAWFSVDWQYNGKSLGNVRISNIGTNGALLQGLEVVANIMDDNIVYPTSNPTYAALRIRFNYRFTRLIGSDWIAITDLHLYGDGTHESSSRWVQD